jgi:hypothetical protein
MTQTSKQAGQSTREMAKKRRRTEIYWAIFCILVIFAIVYVISYPERVGIGGIGGMGLLGLLVLMKVVEVFSKRQMSKQSRLESRAIRGAKGEEKVGALLMLLNREEYAVFHDVECPHGNIDHLVLSKNNGLFLIETKAHGGRVEIVDDKLLVNGKSPEKDFIAQTLRNTYWLREKIQEELGIKAWVQPVIVFTNAFVKFGKPVKGIHITNKKYLVGFIQRERKANSSNNLLWDQREVIKETINM